MCFEKVTILIQSVFLRILSFFSAEKSSVICESLLQRAGLPCFSQNWTSNVAFHVGFVSLVFFLSKKAVKLLNPVVVLDLFYDRSKELIVLKF